MKPLIITAALALSACAAPCPQEQIVEKPKPPNSKKRAKIKATRKQRRSQP